MSRVVIAARKSVHAVKAADADFADRAFGTARKHHVGVTAANDPSRFTDCMQTGGASRHGSKVRAAQVFHDANQTRSHVDDASGDHEGRDATRTAFEHRLVVDANGFQTADARADNAAGAITLFVFADEIETGIFESFGRSRSGKLHIAVITASFLGLQAAGRRIKILDFTGNTATEFGSVKFSNRSTLIC